MSPYYLEFAPFLRPCARPASSKHNSMGSMFFNAGKFNQDLSHFDTSSVVNFKYMFFRALRFNQDISMWDLGSAKFLQNMFSGGAGYWMSFDQDLCAWGSDLDKAADVAYMFYRTGCSNATDPDLSQTPPGPFCYPCQPPPPSCISVPACTNQVWLKCKPSCNTTCFTNGVKGCCTDGKPSPAYIGNVRAKYETDHCKCTNASVCVAQVWTSCGPSCNTTATCFSNALEGCCPGPSTPTISYKSQSGLGGLQYPALPAMHRVRRLRYSTKGHGVPLDEELHGKFNVLCKYCQ